MTEPEILMMMGLGAAVSLVFLLVFFVTGPSTQTSNFESWIAARNKAKLAELEVKKLEAEHARKCPRLTDTPRE